MANLKDIRNKIKSVKSIQQVTKAMKMVAAAKLRKSQENMEKSRPYSGSIKDTINSILPDINRSLLPILDSLELGLSASANTKNVDELYKGIELTIEMFNKTLEKFGVKIIDPQGEKFNPELHEAVSMQEIEDFESGIVVRVMQKGYSLNERLIRPAMVVVAK